MPGYGSQYIGMGKELYDNSRLVQEYFELASTCLDINFVKLCFAESDTELSQISAAYPALFLLQAAGAGLLLEAGISLDTVSGHDIGMFGALFAAGGINLPDGLYLLSKWAQWYGSVIAQGEIEALAIKNMNERTLKIALGKITKEKNLLDIGIYEEKNYYVVFGAPKLLRVIEKYAIEEEARVDEWPIEIGTYTSAVEKINRSFALYLEKVDCKDLRITLVHGGSYNNGMLTGAEVKKFLQRYFIKPLHWDTIIDSYVSATALVIPMRAPALKKQLEKAYPDKPVFMLSGLSELDKIVSYVQHNVSSTKIEGNSDDEK